MALTVTCQTCGKSLTLNAADAGRPTMCHACGAFFLAPPLEQFDAADLAAAQSPPPPYHDTPLPPLPLPDLPSPPHPTINYVVLPAPRPSRNNWLLNTAITLAVFVVAILFGIFIVKQTSAP
ncbi:MAG: hypothetical protein NTU53_13995, partial [Planctomycetota bacterium]|nr:hypothetical protein [Planctomycetota bacterium]